MRFIVIVAACVVPCLSLLAGQKKSSGVDPDPGSRIAEALKGNFDQKIVIDHRKYEEPGSIPIERSFEDIPFSYPENLQLVPNIPVSPHSPKYALVPVKPLQTTTTQTSIPAPGEYFNFSPTFQCDFQEEIDKIRIPHVGRPGFITDPPSITDEEDNVEDDEEEDENNEEDEPNLDKYFSNDFLEPPEFRETLRSTRSPPIPMFTNYQARDVKVTVHSSNAPGKPIIVTKTYPAFDDDHSFEFEDDENKKSSEIPTQSNTKLIPDFRNIHGPSSHCNEKIQTPLQHYGPPKPMSPARQFRSPQPVLQHHMMQRYPRARIYLRYPRNYKTYYPFSSPSPYNRIKVMTQNFVQHPRNMYRLGSSTMPTMGEFRTVSTAGKKKKKKKKIKGQCKPKKIIKEIHYHHYDPQLSAQLAPLEGINLKEGDDYESDIKVITKETEIEDNVKKGHTDYEQHNKDVEKEMRKGQQEREGRLKFPEFSSDSYNPQYPDSGSTEYIDYNLKTDSHSTLHEPHPAHDYPQNDRSFQLSRILTEQPRPLQAARLVTHDAVNYIFSTANSHSRSK